MTFEIGVEVERLHPGPGGAQAIGPFGVSAARDVVEAAFVGDQQQGHATEGRA